MKLTNEQKIKIAKTSTSGKILNELAQSKDRWVRRTVARNENTPSETLNQLANDSVVLVVLGVVLNAKTSIYTLEKIAQGKNELLKQTARGRLVTMDAKKVGER